MVQSKKAKKSSATFSLSHKVVITIGLVLFVIQHSAVVLLMRHGTTGTNSRASKPTIVVLQELIKLFVSIIVGSLELSSISQAITLTFKEDFFPMMIPSLLYGIQNNLTLLALSCLPAAVFEVTYQVKLITAAFFSVLLLKKKLSILQWLTIIILASGVALVKVSETGSSGDSLAALDKDNAFVGFSAVLGATICSGLAGSCFEIVLYRDKSSTKASNKISLWIRNIQMAFGGVLMGLIILFKERSVIKEFGFFYGYSTITWAIIALNSGGGFLIAVIIKRLGIVVKGFAAGIAIIMTCSVSLIYSSLTLSYEFLLGTFLVLFSVICFAVLKANTKKPSSVPHKYQKDE